jgi:hypothetical protein
MEGPRSTGPEDQSEHETQYLDLALGLSTPPPPSRGESQQPLSAGLDSSIHLVAFGNSACKKEKKPKGKSRRPRRKGSSIAPDEQPPDAGSPAAKTSDKKTRLKKKSSSSSKSSKKASSGLSGVPCTESLSTCLCLPFKRFGNYLARKVLCCAYLKAAVVLAGDIAQGELFRQPKQFVAIIGQ